jgi:glycosyltransferase involved in cell wall biosynthesis
MALGCPVLATSGSGFEEIIEDGKSGYLVAPGESALLAHKMICLLKDRQERNRIGEGAKARSADFEVSKIVPELVRYYEKIRGSFIR